MALILIIAILAIAALTLPTATNPILPRDYPPPQGIDQGLLFSKGLEFTTYANKSCQGDGHAFKGAYGYYAAFQMQSYSLSRSLADDEQLDFFTGNSTGLPDQYSVDHATDGHYTEACLFYDSTAGVNATTHDNQGHNQSHGRNNGCHTLKNNEWCANLYITSVG